MTNDTQQFVIKTGLIGLLIAIGGSMVALTVIAALHDGTIASQMVGIYQGIIQNGISVVAGLLGVHTIASAWVAVKGQPTPPPAAPSGALTTTQP